MNLDCWGDDLVDPNGHKFPPKPPSEKAINSTLDRVIAESYPLTETLATEEKE